MATQREEIKAKIESIRLENSGLSFSLYTKVSRKDASGVKRQIKKNERTMNQLFSELNGTPRNQ